ncbi:MAG: amidohydrolase [Candidatus Eisenbacteria bacterium]|nr:amidohydrolase [Candidatus Eisenbacteria bacterium]
MRRIVPIPRLVPLLLILLAPVPAAAGEEILPDFARLAAAEEARAIEDRQWFHARPELAGREWETRAGVRERLSAIPGVELVEGDWGTGVVAILRGLSAKPLVAWRSDMDALPITETTGLPFASTRTDTLRGKETGLSHACGHDLHMSITLGAARVLSAARDRMPGSILFLFQPAEETGDGAAAMLDAGVFDGERKPACVFALHDHPTLRTGRIGSCPGWATANVDVFRLVVKGSGGHGAYPHRAVDPVLLASRMVTAFPSIIAREIDVNHHAVISVGSIEGGNKSSVIPGEVTLTATVRSHDEETRLALRDKVERTVRGLAASAGAPEPELEYFFGTPAGYNDPKLVERAREVFRRVVGPENETLYPPGMGGEDFSRFGRVVPGFQFRLGVSPEGGDAGPLHSSGFDPDERAIAIGVRVVAELLWDRLIVESESGGL